MEKEDWITDSRLPGVSDKILCGSWLKKAENSGSDESVAQFSCLRWYLCAWSVLEVLSVLRW